MWRKAILLSLREKKIFTIFTLIYTVLIFSTSFFLELALPPSELSGAGFFLIIFFGTSVLLSLLYAWILVSRKRRVWATFKCIGYTNRNIISLVSGMILFTTIIGFVIVIELLFHYTAALAYLQSAGLLLNMPAILIRLLPVIITSGLFIFVQVLAFILVYRKVLKVRPIIALKKVGE